MLVKNPGFTVVAALTLALGIGVNSAIFSIVNAALFKPLPVAAPDELVAVYNTKQDAFLSHQPLAYPDYEDFRDRSQVFEGLIGYSFIPLVLDMGDEDVPIMGEIVTENYFATLGIEAMRGRIFQYEEDRSPGTNPLAVLSHATWQRRFGADTQIVGRQIHINGNSFTIIGITPPEFTGLTLGITPELWVPMGMSATLRADDPDRLKKRDSRWMFVMGRLKRGRTAAQANAELGIIASQLEQQYPESNKGRTVKVMPASQIRILPGVDTALYATSLVLMAVVGLVLLIACANVANMLLARAASRRKEMALRLALGARRGRIIRQLLTEGLLLSLLGGALGLLAALWSNSLLTSMQTQFSLPVQLSFGLELDARVMGFTFAASMLTALLFGLAPALEASRTELISALKDEGGAVTGGRSKGRFRNLLVVAQVSLSVLLLIAAGLFVRSLQKANDITPGFESKNVATASFNASLRGYSREQGETFYRQLRDRINNLPGVESVSYASHVPLSFEIRTTGTAAEGNDSAPEDEWPELDTATVGPDYFDTLRIPILSGRGFLETDTAQTKKVVVVNETLAGQFWPGQESLGKRLRFEKEEGYYEVIGVARVGKYRTLGEQPRPYVYKPLLQAYESSQTLLVRVAGETSPALAAIRQEARQLDSRVPVINLQTLEEKISVSLLIPRIGAGLFGLFGLLGLSLAVAGIYGVIAYTVSQRRHEIGIRIALGARPADILKLVIRQGMRLTIIGMIIGLLAAALLTGSLSAVLYGISPVDLITFTGVSLILAAVAMLACYIPARRATRVDPMKALRYE